ncbi:hypothetical protein BH18PSE1_BH18PSE1_10040 [soil metagenome]
MDLNGRRILVTGALGQIGFVPALRARVDPARVVASDIHMPRPDSPLSEGLLEISADHTEADIGEVLAVLGAFPGRV